jgi:hypothetical protein
MAPPEQPPDSWWEPIWELVVHVLIGSVLFAIIFAPAVGLDLAVRWLKTSLDVSEPLLILLTSVKYFVAGVDALVYVAYILRMTWRFLRKLFT